MFVVRFLCVLRLLPRSFAPHYTLTAAFMGSDAAIVDKAVIPWRRWSVIPPIHGAPRHKWRRGRQKRRSSVETDI